MHGCYWPHPSATPDVLSVSDRDTEKEEYEVQEGQPLSSPAATDATMADEEANEAVSVHSSSSESPTIPSTEQPEEDDARMEDDDSANTSSADEDDCLSNRPAPLEACPAQDEMLEAEDDARSMLPPQDVEPPSSSPTSHFSESPITSTRKADGISSVHGSLGIPSLEVSSQATSRRLGTTWATVRKLPTQVIKLAVLSLLQEREAPRLQQGLPVTAGLPHRLRHMGGGSNAVSSRSLPTQ